MKPFFSLFFKLSYSSRQSSRSTFPSSPPPPPARTLHPEGDAWSTVKWFEQVRSECAPHLPFPSSFPARTQKVSQYKLAMSVFVVPAVVAAGAGTLSWGLRMHAAASCVISPMWLWMTVRWMEDGVACASACVELSRLLLRRDEVSASEGCAHKPGPLWRNRALDPAGFQGA